MRRRDFDPTAPVRAGSPQFYVRGCAVTKPSISEIKGNDTCQIILLIAAPAAASSKLQPTIHVDDCPHRSCSQDMP